MAAVPDDAAFTWDTPPPKTVATPHSPLPPAAPEEPPDEAQPPPPPAAPPPVAEVPDSHLLVPRDAWDKVLSQLGNLHEAGQQLAEARERAAKAETEVVFLRERLAEMRERLEPPEPPPPPEPAPEPPPATGSLTARLTDVWRALRGS